MSSMTLPPFADRWRASLASRDRRRTPAAVKRRAHRRRVLRGFATRLVASLTTVTAMHMAAGPLYAQEPPVVANLSLDELNNLRVKISSVTEKPVRQQPGIVSVITEREIAESGATDLMDILELVPGFSFATDVGNVIGTGFRGLWGYEGKILVLLDGIQVNDGLCRSNTRRSPSTFQASSP